MTSAPALQPTVAGRPFVAAPTASARIAWRPSCVQLCSLRAVRPDSGERGRYGQGGTFCRGRLQRGDRGRWDRRAGHRDGTCGRVLYVDIYFDSRLFAVGKVVCLVDRDGQHNEMGLRVLFGCYLNLFDVMATVVEFKNHLLKDHVDQSVNIDGTIGVLDFSMGAVGAPFNGIKALASTSQLWLSHKLANALRLGRNVMA